MGLRGNDSLKRSEFPFAIVCLEVQTQFKLRSEMKKEINRQDNGNFVCM